MWTRGKMVGISAGFERGFDALFLFFKFDGWVDVLDSVCDE